MTLMKVCALLCVLRCPAAQLSTPAVPDCEGQPDSDVWQTGFVPGVIDGSPVTPPCKIFPVLQDPRLDNPDTSTSTPVKTNTTTALPVKTNTTTTLPVKTNTTTTLPVKTNTTTTVKPPVIQNRPNPVLTFYKLWLINRLANGFAPRPPRILPRPPHRGPLHRPQTRPFQNPGWLRFAPQLQGAPGLVHRRRRWSDSSEED
ncbi:hypothetical protein AOLI_G00152980 [Acnodon oligacanthus]